MSLSLMRQYSTSWRRLCCSNPSFWLTDKGPQKSVIHTLLDQWSEHTGCQSLIFTSISPVKSSMQGSRETNISKRKEVRQAWLTAKSNPLILFLLHFPKPNGGDEQKSKFPGTYSPWSFLLRRKRPPDSCSQGGLYQSSREQMASSLRSKDFRFVLHKQKRAENIFIFMSLFVSHSVLSNSLRPHGL